MPIANSDCTPSRAGARRRHAERASRGCRSVGCSASDPGRRCALTRLQGACGAALLLLVLLLPGCGESARDELAGTWQVEQRFGQPMPEGVTETRTFHDDGTLTIKRSDMEHAHTVRWEVAGEWRIRIDPGDTSDAPPNDYTYRVDGDTLTIAGEAGETVLVRVRTR